MKKTIMLVLSASLLVMIGCEDNKMPAALESPELLKPGMLEKSQNTSREKFKIEHDKIAKYIAKNPEVIPINKWSDLSMNPIPISEFGLDQFFPKSFMDDRGLEYEYTIEIYQGSDLTDQTKIRVAIDPDRFPEKKEQNRDLVKRKDPIEFPTYLAKTALGRSSGTLRSEKVQLKTTSSPVPYTLIFVTAEQKKSEIGTLSKLPCGDCGGGGGGGGTTPKSYLSVVAVTLTSSMDYSSEEFELFVRTGDGDFPSTTIHRFNGGDRNDAAGNSRTYKDVNGSEVLYTMDEPIAIARLYDNDTAAKILPIEDDNNGGEFAQFVWQANPDTQTLETNRHNETSNPEDEEHSISVGEWAWFDEDDYYNSAFRSFTKSNMSDYQDPNQPLVILAGKVTLELIRQDY